MLRHALDDPGTIVDEFIVAYQNHEIPFSNWSAHQIKLWGKTFATAEHAFQYKKFEATDPTLARQIQRAPSPWLARELSWSKPISRRSWDKQREAVMREIIIAKVAQHEDVRRALLATKRAAIVEKGSEGDEFWGIGTNGKGRNTLGMIWVTVRDSLAESIKR